MGKKRKAKKDDFADVVEKFRKLLMTYYANKLSMDEISDRAHRAAQIIFGKQ